MCWNTIAAGKWKARPWNSGPAGEVLMAKTSHCQLELDVWFADVVSHKPEGEFEGIAPLRILSFDIECAGRPGVFPEAEKDPVIQIANHVTLQGENAPVFKNVFTLDTCASISGAQVVSFEKEADMLKAWSEFVRQCDPDLMTGYGTRLGHGRSHTAAGPHPSPLIAHPAPSSPPSSPTVQVQHHQLRPAVPPRPRGRAQEQGL